jgi:hypothetical protein
MGSLELSAAYRFRFASAKIMIVADDYGNAEADLGER